MLHILFFILKLIGIILASILGILIVLLLIVLFVPIRYRIDGKKYDSISLEAKIGWLLRILYCHILYDDTKLSIKFSILGKIYYDNNNNNNNGNKLKKRKQKKKNRKSKAKSRNVKSRNVKSTKTTQEEIKSNTIPDHEEPKQMNTDRLTGTSSHMNLDGHIDSQIFAKIKHFFIKLKEKIISIINFIKNIKSKITLLWNKWEKIKAFYRNKTNKAGIEKIWISIKKLVRHIYPTKLRIELEYGTGDPCDTGQALGVMAAFYGYYGNSIKVTPNFETEIFEGTLYCKGRIRIFTLLIISIKLILDKNFRKLIQNFNSMKEEL